MTLINKDFLKEVMPHIVIKKIVSSVSVKGVEPRKHSLVDYATINLYFPGNKCCTAAVHREVHMVNGLKAKMLIGIDILGRKNFTIDTGSKRTMIGSCDNIVLPLEVAPQSQT